MSKKYNILVLGELAELDDDFRSRLLREHYSTELIRVENIDHFRRAIQDPDIDLILIDIIPYGLVALDIVMEKAPMRPLVVVGDSEHIDTLLIGKERGLQRSIIRLKDRSANRSLLLLEIHAVLEQLAEPPSMKYITVDELMRYAQYHNVHQPFFVVDLNGRLLYFNHVGSLLIRSLEGRDVQLRDSPQQFQLADTLEEFEEYLARAFRGESFDVEWTVEELNEQEKYREVIYQPVRTPEHGIIAVSVVCRSIWARRQADKKFAEREDELWSYFELVPLPLVLIDESLGIERNNVTYQDLLGFERGLSLHGKKICGFVMSEDESVLKTAIKRVLSAETPYFQGSHRYRDHEGLIVWVHHIGFAIDNPTNGHRSVLLIAVDVTRQREAEARNIQTHRMKAIGELAGGVAHDFNNVLAIVSAISYLLKGELEELELDELVVYADKMIHAVQRGVALTHQLLSIKRDERIEQEVIELNTQLVDIRELLVEALGDKVELDVKVAATPLPIRLGIGQFEQIFMNFAVNARDAMLDGGTLRITTREIQIGSTQTSPRADLSPGNWAMIAFSDTGTGMDAETRRHVFEPFFTTKAPGKGTGMGLATVYRIVEKMGGKMYVDSTLGQGTTFTLYVPISEQVVDKESSLKTRQLPHEEDDKSAGFILLLEDEDDLRTPYRIFLERAGYRVVEAANIKQAQEVFDTRSDEVTLFLADIVLPDGSGVELAERIRKVKPDLEVVFISGYAPDLVYREPKMNSKAWAFLPKPVSREKLVSVVDTHLVRAAV